jgi:hypothetical protein
MLLLLVAAVVRVLPTLWFLSILWEWLGAVWLIPTQFEQKRDRHLTVRLLVVLSLALTHRANFPLPTNPE